MPWPPQHRLRTVPGEQRIGQRAQSRSDRAVIWVEHVLDAGGPWITSKVQCGAGLGQGGLNEGRAVGTSLAAGPGCVVTVA